MIRVCDDREVELDAELVRRAVVLSACLGGYTSDYLRYGLDGLAHHYSGDEIGVPWAVAEDLLLEACPQTLLGCNDVWACHQRLPVTTECDDGAVTRCEGQLAINCPQGKAIQDCEVTTGGEGECRVLGDGASARAQCVLSDECTGGTEKRCEGDWLVACHESGPEYGENCAERGLTCRDGRCAARAEPQSCTDLGQAACDGDRIRVCTSAGELYERDCSRLGEMTCKEDSGDRPEDAPWFDCVAEGCYAPFEYPDQCRGVDLMLALADGTRSPLHCPDYGFSTCSNGRCAP